jgi:molecular chaperone IbpA
MTTVDFAPLFRIAIGFDRYARLWIHRVESDAQSYPPYNIKKTGDDTYRQYGGSWVPADDLDITVKDNTLFIG